MNYLFEKRGKSSLVFTNLKNLEYLSYILGYITLHEKSIFQEQFELNFKIIYIAERVYYIKKSNNDKVYLSALLSKNKYYKTKQFWRDILELKLAYKLSDHIKRFKNLIIQKKPKNNILGFFGNVIGRKGNQKNGILTTTRIFPLLKDYDLLNPEQLDIINKVSIQELKTIIKDNR